MRARTMIGIGVAGSAAGLLWIRPWRHRIAPSALLDGVLPEYEFRDIISLPIPAPTERILRAMRRVTLREMPMAWLLTELRYLPQRLGGHGPMADPDQPFLGMLRTSSRTIVLAEAPLEVVMGTAGRIDRISDPCPEPLNGGRAFSAFDRTGCQKLAMSLRVVSDGDGIARAVVEHRTHAIGQAARLRFAVSWLVLKPAGALLTWLMLLAVRRAATAPLEEPERPAPEEPGVEQVVDGLEATFA